MSAIVYGALTVAVMSLVVAKAIFDELRISRKEHDRERTARFDAEGERDDALRYLLPLAEVNYRGSNGTIKDAIEYAREVSEAPEGAE